MEETTYTLEGFDWPFVNERPITFEQPLPSVCVCVNCEVVAANAVLLPCGHTLCGFCLNDACDGGDNSTRRESGNLEHTHCFGSCPLDGEPFEKEDVVDLCFPLERLMALPVYCFHASLGCPFDGVLGELQHHLLECIFGTATFVLTTRCL
ncbi:uncharacterized protein LOC142558517 [Dermacentor variabilis]|uniref:uncharacterized protein LOC142558507 n=1 Tax=Dermacentor variabilis TaxID=34621 RepID=UPI003F5B6720